MEEERLDILKRVEAGELTAAEAEELLDALEAGEESEPGWPGEEFTDITEWSPEGPITRLEIDNFVGETVARAGAETLVVVTVRVRAEDAEAAKSLFDKIKISFDEKGGKARVKADVTKGLLDFFDWRQFRPRNVSVDFDVTMPADAVFAANAGHGAIETDGISEVAARLANGRVVTDGSDVKLKVGNGRVSTRAPRKLELDIGNGEVDIVEADALKDMELNMGNGCVALAAGRLNEAADYEMRFGNGTVHASLTAEPTDCEIKVKAVAGSVEGDLSFERKGGKWVYRAGSPKAKVKIASAVGRVSFEVKEV